MTLTTELHLNRSQADRLLAASIGDGFVGNTKVVAFLASGRHVDLSTKQARDLLQQVAR